MGEDCHDIERYRDEQAEYAQTAADSSEKDLLKGGTRNMSMVLLLYHGFTTAFWSALT
jgi:hypothetical protein